MIFAHVDPKPIRRRPDPKCTCGKPIMIVILPGEHIHPCPVHPEHAIYGPDQYLL